MCTDYDTPTYCGITLGTFSSYAQQFGLSNNESSMQNMTMHQISTIYREQFWDKIAGDQIVNKHFVHELFSLYINSKGHAIEALQTTLNKCYGYYLQIDGSMGDASSSNTLRALNFVLSTHQDRTSFKSFIEHFNQEMEDKYQSFENYDNYGNGWDARLGHYSWESFYEDVY